MKCRQSMSGVVAVVLAMTLLSSCSVHRLSDEQVGSGGAQSDAIVEAGAGGVGELGDDPATTVPGAPSTTAAGGPGGTAGSAPAPGAPRPPSVNVTGTAEARKSSDRGLTPDVLNLGILATSEQTFAALGASETKKAEDVIKPFIDEINAQGGINGRKVVTRITRYDPLTPDTMQAACVEQAEDFKVFASIAQGGFFGDAEVCMATKQTPLITGNGSSAHTSYEREKGWVRSTAQNKDRNAKIWIDWMLEAGLLSPSVKTGILYTDVPEDRQLIVDVVVPYLKSKGINAPELFAYSAPIANTATESQSAVVQFSARNVTLVLPFISFLRMLLFTQQAEANRYRPKYSASDFGVIASDATAGFPPAQWEGVTGITTLRTGIDPPGAHSSSPQFKDCEAAYNKYGQQLKDGDAIEYLNMTHYCQHIALFADAARRSGVNPTRRSFLEAVGATGTWSHRVVYSERLTYTPQKYDGPDLYAVVKWQSGCNSSGGCYRQIRGFRLGAW